MPVRTLVLQPPPPGCNTSCAAHALKLARSERPSERQCTRDVGAPPRARCILSYFIRDQGYLGIKNKNGKRQVSTFAYSCGKVSGFLPEVGVKNLDLFLNDYSTF